MPGHDTRDFAITLMQRESVALLVRAGHPLVQAGRVTLTEVLDGEWIMQPRGAPIHEATLQSFAALGLPEPRNIVYSASLLFTITYLAQSGAIAPVSTEAAKLLICPPIGAELAVRRSPDAAGAALLPAAHAALMRQRNRAWGARLP